MSLSSQDFAKSEPEHRCKRCASRFEHLKSKFLNYGKPKVAEDAAGLSSDGVATNSAGAGNIDEIGIGARGEPGGRKRRRDARRKNPKLFAALQRGGIVEMVDYEEEADREGSRREHGPDHRRRPVEGAVVSVVEEAQGAREEEPEAR